LWAVKACIINAGSVVADSSAWYDGKSIRVAPYKEAWSNGYHDSNVPDRDRSDRSAQVVPIPGYKARKFPNGGHPPTSPGAPSGPLRISSNTMVKVYGNVCPRTVPDHIIWVRHYVGSQLRKGSDDPNHGKVESCIPGYPGFKFPKMRAVVGMIAWVVLMFLLAVGACIKIRLAHKDSPASRSYEIMGAHVRFKGYSEIPSSSENLPAEVL
jgi:hypothetical protein